MHRPIYYNVYLKPKRQKTLHLNCDNHKIATSGMSKARDIFLIHITVPSFEIESKTYIIII